LKTNLDPLKQDFRGFFFVAQVLFFLGVATQHINLSFVPREIFLSIFVHI